MPTPYDWLAKIYTNCYGHMTKIATMPIYGKNSLNIFFSGTKRSNLIPNAFYGKNLKIVNEYDQEIPQSQTADNPMAP